MQLQEFLGYHPITLISKQRLSSLFLTHTETSPPQEIVIKIFDALHLKELAEQECFLQEAKQIQALNHPHILSFSSYGMKQSGPYLISPYFSHGSLRFHLNQSRFSLEKALEILEQVGAALISAHEHHLIHDNLKPENVLFTQDKSVVLMDFHLPSLRQKMQELGLHPNARTTAYMAPEAFQGHNSPKSDQYALGCLAFELITGSVPFPALAFSTSWNRHSQEIPPSMKSFVPTLPERIETVILKAMDKQPGNRYEDIGAFLRDLVAPHVSLSLAITEFVGTHPPLKLPGGDLVLNPARLADDEEPDTQDEALVAVMPPVQEAVEPSSVITPPLPDDPLKEESIAILANSTMIVPDPEDGPVPDTAFQEREVMDRLFSTAPQHKKVFLRTSALALLVGILLLSVILVPVFVLPTQTRKPENKTRVLNPTSSAVHITVPEQQSTPFVQTSLIIPSAQPTQPTSTASTLPQNGNAAKPPASTPAPAATQAPSLTQAPSPLNALGSTYFDSFEDGGLDNWDTSSGVQLQNSTTTAASGSHSLQVSYAHSADGNGEHYYQVATEQGGTHTTIQGGQNLSAYVYIPPGSVEVSAHIYVQDGTYQWYSDDIVPLTSGQWLQLTYVVPSSLPLPIYQMGIQFVAFGNGVSGTFYVDAVKWS